MEEDRDVQLVEQENHILVQSTIAATLGSIPTIGSFLAEAYRYGDVVQQKRLLNFVDQLSKYLLEETGIDINRNYIQSDDFKEFFRLILEKSKTIKSEEKIRRFQRILLYQIECPYKSDFTLTFLDIAERINEMQINILNEFRKIEMGEKSVKYLKEERGVVNGGNASGIVDPLDYLDGIYFKIDEPIYLFYVQDLVSKGLLYDDGMGRLGVEPFQALRITPFGTEFLSFIERRTFRGTVHNS